jgi:hypothetical protein
MTKPLPWSGRIAPLWLLPTALLPTIPAAGTEGITGIIADNASAGAQASSIYFTCVTGNLAFKSPERA